MVKAIKTASLNQALAELCAEREDGGASLTLEDVCRRAQVGRATAYRGKQSFKEVFDGKIAAIRSEGATGGEVSAGKPEKDTRAAYRKLADKLTNQIQALTLELEAQKRARTDAGSVIPFPGKQTR